MKDYLKDLICLLVENDYVKEVITTQGEDCFITFDNDEQYKITISKVTPFEDISK